MNHTVFDPIRYWQWRYRAGGISGAGSRGELAQFKAEVVNQLIATNEVRTVIDLGCGDGVQFEMLQAPAGRSIDYLGVDVSPEALARCVTKKSNIINKRFMLWNDFVAAGFMGHADLTLSMDVIYHLTDDAIFISYIDELFRCSNRIVLIYSSDINAYTNDIHVRHRQFSETVGRRHPKWRRVAIIPNRFPHDPMRPMTTSFADFHVFADPDLFATINL